MWEGVNVSKDGRRIPVEISNHLFELEGKPIILSVARDETERCQAEEQRLKLEVQLHQAQKMESVGRLAGGVAQDFNNFLTVILGHVQLALLRLESTHPVYADLMQINKAGERSANLTQQLLAFARKQTINPKVLDLNETVEGMFKMLRRLIGELECFHVVILLV